MNPPTAKSPWPTTTLIVLALVAWTLFWYRDTALAMVEIWWRSETFNHAFLVPLISLWLIWRQRHVLAEVRPVASPLWLVLMAGAGFAWLLGELAAVNAVTQFALVGLLVLISPVLLGARITWQISFALAFLFFSVPFGEFMMPMMMQHTADFTVFALRLTGIPVYREGLQFVIPSGNWSVVEACSGVRYLIASIVVGTLYAYINYRSLKRRLIFIGVSILVPLVANWLRAYMIVMLGHLSGNTLAVGVDHLIYGWVFFGVVIMIVFAIGMRWAENTDPTSIRQASDAAPAPAHAAGRQGIIALLAAAVIAAPPVWLSAVSPSVDNASPPSLAPVEVVGWSLSDERRLDWKPAYDNPSTEWQGEFVDVSGRRVGVYLGYYRDQGYTRKLVSSQNVLVVSKDEHWARVAGGSQETRLSGETLHVPRTELRATAHMDQRLIVRHWYWVGGRLETRPAVVKLYTALDKLLGRGDDGAVVMVYTEKDGPGEPDATLDAFTEAAWPALARMLDTAKARR